MVRLRRFMQGTGLVGASGKGTVVRHAVVRHGSGQGTVVWLGSVLSMMYEGAADTAIAQLAS